MSSTFSFAGGRECDLLLAGDERGFPLVLHHGTPSDATIFADWHEACLQRKLRLVCLSRPGYATSTRVTGRNVAHVAADTAAVLDTLGHGKFVTAGWSGGGPHALACAALLPQRCLKVATLAGVGPYGKGDLDFLAGMGEDNVVEFGAALGGEAKLREWMRTNGEPLRAITAAQVGDALGDLVAPIDKQVLAAGYAEVLAASFRRAIAVTMDGWIDDDLAFTRPWGFELEQVRAPVVVWQGDLDRMVPFAHGRWLARHLPHARGRMVDGHGHISLVTRYRGEILDDLATH